MVGYFNGLFFYQFLFLIRQNFHRVYIVEEILVEQISTFWSWHENKKAAVSYYVDPPDLCNSYAILLCSSVFH